MSLATPARRLRSDRSGAVSVVFAIMFAVFFLAAAVAMDWALGTNEKMREQDALDAATLAASDKLGTEDQDASGQALAEAFYSANTGQQSDKVLTDIKLDAEKGEVVARADYGLATTLLKAVGIKQQAISNRSTVLKAVGSVEIALVLDNSGSMAGQPILDLKAAAKSLISTVFVGAVGTDKVMAGLVPFAASVNVGQQSVDAGWIDTAGDAPTHDENFAARDLVAARKTRLQLFQSLGVAWGGCVEARPSPHDVEDSVPATATPATMFVPMFAPDEPDDNNDGDGGATVSYPNNYLYDSGGSCPDLRTCKKKNKRGNCVEWNPPPPIDPAVAQARTCKYDLGVPDTSKPGPNLGCTTAPVLPLTSTKGDIEAAIDSMVASGNTNIPEGLMWGWRLLSPEAPYTEGRAAGEGDNNKIIVLMTDGENNLGGGYSNQNLSRYTAFGYAAKGRIGTTYTQTGFRNQLNTKLETACTNAKAAGMKIYTIAFRLESDATTTSLLAACSSGTEFAFKASDGSGLKSAFKAIGRQITQLRVAG
jgi:Flp pilus assembly protein TadG